MSDVTIQNFSKRFDNVTAVDDLTLQVKSGELLVILGPSGSGKTTLLRMIAGLEVPDTGQIWIDDENVTELPTRKRRMSMVFQNYALYPHMTIYKNIAFPIQPRGFFKKADNNEIREKVRRVAHLLEIEPFMDRKPAQLSGGQRQRVALARAMITQPALLLLDEPLSNLDARLRVFARDELKRFQRDLGVTSIFVTHNQNEAMSLGTRIVIMADGKIQQIGTPTTIYNDPDNIFVATFVGSPPMNIIHTEHFDYGFRPDYFRPEDLAESDDVVRLPFRVHRVEYPGADCLIYGKVAQNDTLLVSRIPSTSRLPFAEGQDYIFTVPRDEIKFFNKNTGLRMAPQPLATFSAEPSSGD